MAIKVWKSSGTGQPSLGTNWVGDAVPGTSDTAVLLDGTQAINPNLGQIAEVTNWIIWDTYLGGDVGASGNELTTSVTGTLEHRGNQALWFKDSGGTTDKVLIRCSDPATIVHLGGATINEIRLMRGDLIIDGDIGAISKLIVGYVDQRASDARVVITVNANTLADLIIKAGRGVTSSMAITRATVDASTLTQTSGGDKAINTVVVGPDGRLDYLSSQTIADADVMGTFDFGANAKTVTDGWWHPGAVLLNKQETLHTITNEHDER